MKKLFESFAASELEELLQTARRWLEGQYEARARLGGEGRLSRLAESLNTLADRMRAAIAEISRDKAQLTSILANMAEAVLAVDTEGRILAVNPALVSLFGVADYPVGKPVLEVLRHQALFEIVKSVLENRQPRTEEVSLRTDQERIFEVHASPLLENGFQTGALLVLHDITRLRKLENMRRDFVANVSHELRTPVAAIKGFAETLREGALEDREHRLEFVRSIEEYADRLSILVDDLLELSAIESGQREPRKERISLLETAREAAHALKPLAAKKNVKFEIQEGRGAEILADPAQMRQVFMNLLGNAVKFNKEGGWVRMAERREEGRLKIEVRDSGQGIPHEDLPRVFQRFYRADKSRSAESGGSGLGLAIVKHIIESHGGEVGVESRLGEGAKFYFSLPA